jgi:hypothetical protein
MKFGLGMWLVIILLVVGAGSGNADENPSGNPSANAAAMCTGHNGPITVSRDELVKSLGFNKYEAAKGDLAACKGDQDCLDYAKEFKSMYCISAACSQNNPAQGPASCIPELAQKFTAQDRGMISAAICNYIKDPSDLNEQPLTRYFPATHPGKWERFAAFLSAINGRRGDCEYELKTYLGFFGPKWTFEWYRDLAACSIFAGTMSKDELERDFYIWFGIARGTGTCGEIKNKQLQRACKSPGTCPLPPYAQ